MPGIGLGISPYLRRGGGNLPLLDSYPGAAAAYGTMKLSSTATVSIRVKRDIDNAETDIGFVGNDLDEATLTSFINGSNEVWVVKYYDQSGNGNDLYQNNPANAPIIVDNGVVLKIFDKPAVYFKGGIVSNLTLTNTIDTDNNFSVFSVIKTTAIGAITPSIYSDVAGTPNTTYKYSDDFYYTGGEDGFIKSNSTYTTPDSYYITGIYNGSLKKQYENGTEIPSSYTAYGGGPYPNPLTSTAPSATGYLGAYVIYLSDKSSDRVGIENKLNFFFDIVQSGYIFDVEELTNEAGITGLEDSTNFFRISDTEVGLIGGFGTFPATNNQTDKFFTTSDFITFTDEANPIPVGPCAHVTSSLREDGLIWFFGRSINTGPIIKFFVCTLNPATKVWNTIDADVVGNENYLQWGFFHKDYMYGAFDNGSNYVLRRSSDGLTWTDMCVLPAFAVDSSAWSDGTRIRFAGGGEDIGIPATDLITSVYESLDDGATFSVVSTLPIEMRSVWPNYVLFHGYEIFMSGAWGPTNDDWGVFYFRPLGDGSWTKASTQNRRFAEYFLYPGHAGATLIWNGDLYFGFMANHGTYRVTLA